MNKKSIYFPLSLFCMTYAFAGSSTEQIPEGKITEYHCVHPDITPSAGPRVIDGVNVFLTGDYLFWTAREDNLEFAATGYTNSPSGSVNAGSAASPHFRYENGFKVGLGFNFGHDTWDTYLNYTWFQSNHNTKSVSADYDDGLTPSFDPYIPLTTGDFFNWAHTLWGIHFNSIDWELGRNCYISKYLSLRPFVGIKGSWQKQTFNNQYDGIIGDSSFTYDNNSRSSYWGAGIRSGINTAWHLSENWSLYGDLAFSALWSTCTTHRHDTYTVTAEAEVSPVEQKNKFNVLSPVLELAMGLRKDAWFFHNRLHISLQAGWEEQVWWDQNNFTLDLGIPRGGNLFLQGLAARLRLDF